MFVFSPKDGGSMFLKNFGMYIQVHTALQPSDQHWHFHGRANVKFRLSLDMFPL
jgi:hypothetical protein